MYVLCYFAFGCARSTSMIMLCLQWTVEQVDERRYYIRLLSRPVAPLGDKVWVIQSGQPQPAYQKWFIENHPQMGVNVYT